MSADNQTYKSRIRNTLVYGWWQAQTFVFACGVLGWGVGAVVAITHPSLFGGGGVLGLVCGLGGLAGGYTVGLVAVWRMMEWPHGRF